MRVFALAAVRAFFPVRTRNLLQCTRSTDAAAAASRFVQDSRARSSRRRPNPKKIIEVGTAASERIVRRHKIVARKRVHEKSTFDDLLPFGRLFEKIPIRVVGDDHAARFGGETDDESIVVADDPFALNFSRRRKDEIAVPFQRVQHLLIVDPILRRRLLLAPRRHEDGDLFVTATNEVVDAKTDTATGEDFVISVSVYREGVRVTICRERG